MNSEIRRALLKTLSFHEAWGHAPTLPEWISTAEIDGPVISLQLASEIQEILLAGDVVLNFGRYMFADSADFLIKQIRQNEMYAERKRRRAQKVVRWLTRLSAVRFVALCNTTALGHARDEGDLDFFVIARSGRIMQSRGLAVLPFKLFGLRPGSEKRDAVCLSYFISDDGLDLASHMLKPSDPYFNYWFLSLLPLYDDGISSEFWQANSAITKQHQLALKWIPPPDLQIAKPKLRVPSFNFLEPIAKRFQLRAFPTAIRNLMNLDSRVMVDDKVLKFHVDDRRAEYRQKYLDACLKRGL